MIRALTAVALLALLNLLPTGCVEVAVADEAEKPIPALSDTTSVVIFALDKEPKALIFISKTGTHFTIGAERCVFTPACAALVDELQKTHQIYAVDIETPKGTATQFK